MRKFVEKIVIGVLSVALVLAVLGLVLSLRYPGGAVSKVRRGNAARAERAAPRHGRVPA